MSKIDEYTKKAHIAKMVKEYLDKARGLDHPSNDKHSLSLRYTGKHYDSWNDACFALHASYGYYGSSSGYSAMNEHVAQYIQKAIAEFMYAIADKAVHLAAKDAELARLEAESEAGSVLQQLEAE